MTDQQATDERRYDWMPCPECQKYSLLRRGDTIRCRKCGWTNTVPVEPPTSKKWVPCSHDDPSWCTDECFPPWKPKPADPRELADKLADLPAARTSDPKSLADKLADLPAERQGKIAARKRDLAAELHEGLDALAASRTSNPRAHLGWHIVDRLRREGGTITWADGRVEVVAADVATATLPQPCPVCAAPAGWKNCPKCGADGD